MYFKDIMLNEIRQTQDKHYVILLDRARVSMSEWFLLNVILA